MSKQNCNFESSCRLGKVGGQAVIEGVMMKAGERTVTTCRKEDGSLIVSDDRFVSVRKKNKFLNIPILRGIVNFVEMMMLSFKTLEISANALGLDDEKEESGGALTHTVMIISLILGFALVIALFLFLPTLLAELIDWLADGKLGAWRAAVEGGAKVAILVVYLLLISLMRDIKRTFMYHGAEMRHELYVLYDTSRHHRGLHYKIPASRYQQVDLPLYPLGDSSAHYRHRLRVYNVRGQAPEPFNEDTLRSRSLDAKNNDQRADSRYA